MARDDAGRRGTHESLGYRRSFRQGTTGRKPVAGGHATNKLRGPPMRISRKASSRPRYRLLSPSRLLIYVRGNRCLQFKQMLVRHCPDPSD